MTGKATIKLVQKISHSQDGNPLMNLITSDGSPDLMGHGYSPCDYLNAFMVQSVSSAENVERVREDFRYAIHQLTRAMEATRGD